MRHAEPSGRETGAGPGAAALGVCRLLAAVLLAGCAHAPAPPRPAPPPQHLETPAGDFTIECGPDDAGDVAVVLRAIEAAAPRLARWGGLREPVRILVLPDHAALERAVERPGYAWLRAWARYAVVQVQAPRTWRLGRETQAQADELVLHELTHCLMYQRSAGELDWREKGIPTWFREGMASVTAGHGYPRGTLGGIARLLRSGEDPLGDGDRISRQRSEEVYAAAHYAFEFLLHRYGDEGVRRVLSAMSAGLRFDPAFEEVLGLSRSAFERQFKNHVALESRQAREGTARRAVESAARQEAN